MFIIGAPAYLLTGKSRRKFNWEVSGLRALGICGGVATVTEAAIDFIFGIAFVPLEGVGRGGV